jgi:hypothetical protein
MRVYNPWFDRWIKRTGVIRLDNDLTTFAQHSVTCCHTARCWRCLNRPTVCTVGVIAPGAKFIRFKMCVSQVHSKGGANCRTRDSKLEEGDF